MSPRSPHIATRRTHGDRYIRRTPASPEQGQEDFRLGSPWSKTLSPSSVLTMGWKCCSLSGPTPQHAGTSPGKSSPNNPSLAPCFWVCPSDPQGGGSGSPETAHSPLHSFVYQTLPTWSALPASVHIAKSYFKLLAPSPFPPWRLLRPSP